MNGNHLEKLNEGVDSWNSWRNDYPDVEPDLKGVDLQGASLPEANLSEANLMGANMTFTNLSGANLENARMDDARLYASDLTGANLAGARLNRADLGGVDRVPGTDLRGANLHSSSLSGAYLREANLSDVDLGAADLRGANFVSADLQLADLRGVDLRSGNLSKANLEGVDLTGSDLRGAKLLQTNLTRADLTDCLVYGISVWDVNLKEATQSNLHITDGERRTESYSGKRRIFIPADESPTITVDNLDVAQFVNLLLYNEKIRDIIDTITTKVVLILGRFTPDRKTVLDALRTELRSRNYVPILFDFEKPARRDLTETIRTLAHIARFIIADITEPRSIPHELQAIVPGLAVPVQPLIYQGAKGEYGMFQDLAKKYHWVLPIYQYVNVDDVILSLPKSIIQPAEDKAKELANR